jgi:hypothetical protein
MTLSNVAQHPLAPVGALPPAALLDGSCRKFWFEVGREFQ